jgi:hypothetical protein
MRCRHLGTLANHREGNSEATPIPPQLSQHFPYLSLSRYIIVTGNSGNYANWQERGMEPNKTIAKKRGGDLAGWLERLTVNAKVGNSPGFDPSILRHGGIWGTADGAVLNKKHPKFPLWKKSWVSSNIFPLRSSYYMEIYPKYVGNCLWWKKLDNLYQVLRSLTIDY